MRKNFLVLLWLLIHGLVTAQPVLVDLGLMHDDISEPSGLAMHYNTSSHNFEIWAHNDHNYPDSIFSIELGNFSTYSGYLDLDIIYDDWEDMGQDDNGNLYIGEFGNWVPSANDKIIKIPDPNTYSTNMPSKEIIHFSFPATSNLESEAMFHFGDSLYLIIKNIHGDASHVEGLTHIYRIPDSPAPGGGTYIADLHAITDTSLPGDSPDDFRITGADISPDKNVLVLLSYKRIWVYSCFSGTDFFAGKTQHVNVVSRQYEGICFKNNHEIYISKEGADDNPNYNPKMFYMDISSLIDGGCKNCEKTINSDFNQQNTGWYLFTYGAGDANYQVVGSQAAVDIINGGSSRWHVNLRQKGVSLTNGKSYRVTFKAWAENSDQDISIILNNTSGSEGYAYHLQTITTNPNWYSFEFTMDSTSNTNTVYSFNLGNGQTQTIFLDELSIVSLDCYCPDNQIVETPILSGEVEVNASQEITISSAVSSNSLTLNAGICTNLAHGFRVEQGTLLDVLHDGCP